VTDARAVVYTNTRWLAERLLADAEAAIGGYPFDEGPPAPPVPLDATRVWAIADFMLGLLDVLQEGESADPLAACPALERWRAQVLESRGRQPLEVAAAWELTALVCEHTGLADAAVSARAAAGAAIAARKSA
jgi:hypothetical protein